MGGDLDRRLLWFLVLALGFATLGLEGLERMDGVPGEVVVSIAAGADLVTVELLGWQIAFALDCVEVATPMPYLIGGILALIILIVPQILQKQLPPILVQYLLLF